MRGPLKTLTMLEIAVYLLQFTTVSKPCSNIVEIVVVLAANKLLGRKCLYRLVMLRQTSYIELMTSLCIDEGIEILLLSTSLLLASFCSPRCTTYSATDFATEIGML